MSEPFVRGLGCRPDTHDPRDQTVLFRALSSSRTSRLPKLIDLEPKLPPIWDQGSIGSCTAHAALAAYTKNALDSAAVVNDDLQSRLYQYYNSRLLDNTQDEDVGATIRNSIKAMNKFGVLSETFYPYEEAKFAIKPPGTCYVKAKNHRAVSYLRVPIDVNAWKAELIKGNVIVFGMECFAELFSAKTTASGFIPLPRNPNAGQGGHAVCVVGYNDDLISPTTPKGVKASKGYFKIRNSWGKDWGDRGYGYLPYAYIKHCFDAWVLGKIE